MRGEREVVVGRLANGTVEGMGQVQWREAYGSRCVGEGKGTRADEAEHPALRMLDEL